MGVKSTVTLTRQQAEEKYVELRLDHAKRVLRAEAVVLADNELEDELEHLNDKAHGGEGFENYAIRNGGSSDY